MPRLEVQPLAGKSTILSLLIALLQTIISSHSCLTYHLPISMQHNFVALLIGGVDACEEALDGMAVVLVLLGNVTFGGGLQGGGSLSGNSKKKFWLEKWLEISL